MLGKTNLISMSSEYSKFHKPSTSTNENLNLKKANLTMGISQEEIVTNAQTVTKGLEALRLEHQSLLGGLKVDDTV